MSSTEFRSYGERGPGKWITIYAREGHTFAVIAGLRLDTDAIRSLSRQMGASLANGLPSAERLRRKASRWVVTGKLQVPSFKLRRNSNYRMASNSVEF